jgi:hypothetical protein
VASIGDVYVTVLPETSKIADGIKKALLGVDDDVRKAARRWKQIIDRELSGEEVTVEVKADTKKAEADIEKAARIRRSPSTSTRTPQQPKRKSMR